MLVRSTIVYGIGSESRLQQIRVAQLRLHTAQCKLTRDSNFLSDICQKKSDFWAVLGSVHNADIEAHTREIPRLVMGDKAVNTVKKYSGAVNRWAAWAKSYGFEPLPAMPHAVAIYVAFFMQTTQSIAAINSAIYGYKWAHNKLGRDSPTDDIMLKQLVESASRILSKTRKAKEPLMPYEVKQMVSSLRKGDPQKLQISCMLALGFSGFMRWDDLSNIYVDWTEVLPTHADMFLYKRKNDQFRQGSCVKLARTGLDDCPVAVLEEFMAVGGHTGHSKLFRRMYHSKYGVRLRRQPLTYSRALELVRETFRKFGLNPKDYGLHSLRSGGASAAAATEVPECLIVRQGGWKS